MSVSSVHCLSPPPTHLRHARTEASGHFREWVSQWHALMLALPVYARLNLPSHTHGHLSAGFLSYIITLEDSTELTVRTGLCRHTHCQNLGSSVYSVCELVWCAQLSLTPCDPLDCSPPGFSVRGISQARILEGVLISPSRGPFWPRNRTHISYHHRQILHHWATKV